MKSNKTQITEVLNKSAIKTATKSQTPSQKASSTNVSANVPSFQIAPVANTRSKNRTDSQPLTGFEQINQHEQPYNQSRQTTHIEELRNNENQGSMQVEEPVRLSNNPNTENQGFEEEVKGNNDPASTNSFQAGQGSEVSDPNNLSLTSRTALLDCLRVTKIQDIEKKFFLKKQCLLCGKGVTRKFKDHVQKHIEGKTQTDSNYVFCLQAGGQNLQVKCKKCSQMFTRLTVNKLQEHSQTCSSNEDNLNNEPQGQIISHDSGKQKEMFAEEIKNLTEKIVVLETRLAKTEKKVSGVYKTQGIIKKRLDANDQRVTTVEQDVKIVGEKADNHENVLIKLVNHFINNGDIEKPKEAITDTSVLKRIILKSSETKEKERDRERSRERARDRSQERPTTRQSTRYRTRERSEERKTKRNERSQDKKPTRHYNNGHIYQDRRSDGRSNKRYN